MVRRLTALIFAVLMLALAACGDDDSGEESSSSKSKSASSTETCRVVKAPAPKQDGGESKPRQNLDPSRTYDIEFDTSCGSFTVRLDVEQAPNATSSVAALARKGFYDSLTFHRVVPGFVIQGGDPTGTGTGGPGYTTVDQPRPDTRYTPGVVAMAKAGPDPAGAAGSQFYVVSGPDAATLPAIYAVIGAVTEGMDTVRRIDALGDASDPTGAPKQPVVIEKATLNAS